MNRSDDPATPRPFLTARWESLILLNYECRRELLEPLVPAGTELDDWRGHSLISLVGFMFRGTRVLGVPVPFHRTFEEVNLRFYVRRVVNDEVRRGVVFIRELVPRHAIALVARWRFNEPYLAVPMSSSVALDPASGGHARYTWSFRRHEYALHALATGPARPFEPDSEAAFITEHYWGYTRQRDGCTIEYRVDHPSWPCWEPDVCSFEGHGELLYGREFGGMLAGPPRSAHLAVGSEIAVHHGRSLPV